MRRILNTFVATLAAIILVLSTGPAGAQDREVRVPVPEIPDGIIVSNCYRAVGPIYDRYTFDFCLRDRGTYTVTSRHLHCRGRLNWHVDGVYVQAKLRRTSCGDGMAWTGDSMSCRPSLVLGVIAGLLKQKRPMLDNLICDYRPVRGSGEQPISFVAHRR